MDLEDLITTPEAAELTGYSAHHLWALWGRGYIKGVKRGGVLFLERESCITYAKDYHGGKPKGARKRGQND